MIGLNDMHLLWSSYLRWGRWWPVMTMWRRSNFGFVELPLPCYADVNWLMTKAAPPISTQKSKWNETKNEWNHQKNVSINSSNLNSNSVIWMLLTRPFNLRSGHLCSTAQFNCNFNCKRSVSFISIVFQLYEIYFYCTSIVSFEIDGDHWKWEHSPGHWIGGNCN